jgi:hypothetical protein
MARRDEWSGVFDSRRARWEAARMVNAMLTGGGHPGRVLPAAGAWLVQSGTGKVTVAETISELWEALASARSLPVQAAAAQVAAAPPGPLPPVAAAIAESAVKRRCTHGS